MKESTNPSWYEIGRESLFLYGPKIAFPVQRNPQVSTYFSP